MSTSLLALDEYLAQHVSELEEEPHQSLGSGYIRNKKSKEKVHITSRHINNDVIESNAYKSTSHGHSLTHSLTNLTIHSSFI